MDRKEISDRHENRKFDLILVTLPPWGVESPPLSLGYLAEYLEIKGIRLKVFDFNIEIFNKFKCKYDYLWKIHNQRYWFDEKEFNKLFKIIEEDIKRCVNKIISSKAKIIAFSVSNPKERITIEVIKRIKRIKPNIKIILGGPSCSYKGCRFLFEDKIPQLIDYYIISEGEEILYRLTKAIKNKEDIKKIKGVTVYRNGKYSKLIRMKPMDYNKLDIFPTYSQFDLSKYTNKDMLNVEWSRGCIGNCSFCQNRDLCGRYRSRNPENIVNEIKYHVRKNNIRDFSVCDSTINGDLENLERICDLIIKSGLNIRWSGLAIPKKTSYRLLKKMKKAGCYRLEYGIESGSDKILKSMRKIHKAKEAEKVLRITHKVGIKNVIFIIVGFPGETEEDFKETINFIKRNKEYIDLVRSINGIYISEGTDIKKNPKKYGIVEQKNDETGYSWYTKDGNTPKDRNKKVKRVISLLNELGINHELNTLVERKKRQNEYFKEFFKENLDLVGALNGSRAYKGPDIVQIDLTDKCNLNCVGCWCHSDLLGSSKLKEFDEIPYYLTEKLIQDLYHLGVKEIMLSGGGEPFMHPRIMDIIELIKKRGIKLNIITNFTLLDKEKIKKIVELNVDYITASIWAGDAETYVKTHPNQTEETFKKIKENLKYLYSIKKGNNLPYIKIYNVISKLNCKSIGKMVDFALNTLVDYIEFQVIDIIPGKTDSLRLDEKDKINVKKQILDLKNRKDYFDEFIETRGLEPFDKEKHKKELISFGKFYKSMNKGFRIIAGGNFAICPKGYLSINKFINDIPEKLCFFEFPSEICSKCPNTLECYEHRMAIPLKAKLLKFMGGGTFTRRVSNKDSKEGYDNKIIDSIPCYVGWIYTRILTNGDVIPCCKAHLFPLGNLHKKSFKEIWFSDKYNKFRKKAKKLKKTDKYFKKIDCYKGCDNLGMNLELHRRIKELSSLQKREINKRIKK